MAERESDLGLFRGLGEALHFLRSERGLTQPALAAATRGLGRSRGVATTSISGYERGHSTPTLEVLSKLLEALEVDLPEFVDVLQRIRGRSEGAPPPAGRFRGDPPSNSRFRHFPLGEGDADASDAGDRVGGASALPAYLVVDLRAVETPRRPAAKADPQQILDLVNMARGLVGEARLAPDEGRDESMADGIAGGRGGKR